MTTLKENFYLEEIKNLFSNEYKSMRIQENLLDGLEFYLMLPSNIIQCLLHERL